MELKHYAHIIWKRVWIPLLLVVVTAAVSLLTRAVPPPSYSLTTSFSIGVTPKAVDDEYTFDGNYAWISSEFLADSLTELVGGQKFAGDVNAHLADMNSSARIPAGLIASETKHRILRLSVSWGNPDELAEIGRAVGQAMQQDIIKYFPQAGASSIQITVIDVSGPHLANPQSLRQTLDLPIRIILALAAGIALTFLLDYLDDSVRGRAELEAMGISVLAEVPRK
jgi:capsular polysaccharide biosynthesis protein